MQTVCFAKMHTNHKLPTNHDMMFADGGRKRGIDHELNEEKGEEGGKETGGEGAQHKERGGRRKEVGGWSAQTTRDYVAWTSRLRL